MNKRIATIVMIAALVSTAGGCAPFRNFFFGRGAQCGLCNKLRAPFQRVLPQAVAPPVTPCQQPAYVQPPCVTAPPPCGAPNPCATGSTYGPAVSGAVAGNCCGDPYIGNGVYGAPVNGQGAYGSDWQERYNANYPDYYSPGYKVDRDGSRIIHEELEAFSIGSIACIPAGPQGFQRHMRPIEADWDRLDKDSTVVCPQQF